MASPETPLTALNHHVEANGLEFMTYAILTNLTLVCLYVFICAKLPPRWLFLVPMLLGLVAVYFAHVGLTVIYWELRLQFATTMAEEDVVIASDGANLLLHAMVLGPLVCLISGGLGIIVFLRKISLAHDSSQLSGILEMRGGFVGRAEATKKGLTINPYEPPRFNNLEKPRKTFD